MLQKLQLKNELSVDCMIFFSMINTNCFVDRPRLLASADRLHGNEYRPLGTHVRLLGNSSRLLGGK